MRIKFYDKTSILISPKTSPYLHCKTKKSRMKTQFFNIERADTGAVTIYLYGEIGDYADVRCAHVAAELMAAAPEDRKSVV